jgi:flagellar biosynthesis chaperone FliJ
VRENRLAAVLRLRTIQERRARGELARAEREQVLAEEMLERRRQAPPPIPPRDVLTPLQLRALSLQGVASHELVLAAANGLDLARHARDTAHSQWSEASREQKATERLDERRRAQAAEHARVAAERALDELVVLRQGWQR